MPSLAPLQKYPLAIRVLHWLMALMIIGLLAAGLIMEQMAKDNPYRSSLYALHKSFGLTVLALAALRLILKFALKTPPLPDALSREERFLGSAGHWALYGFMFAMPISGYILTTSFGLRVRWFGILLPKWLGTDRARGEWAADFHEYAAYALMGLITLHVGAVLLHYARQRVNLLRRMV